MAGTVKYPTAESAREASNKPTAYQQMNQSVLGENIWKIDNPAIQPWLAYINTTDKTAKALAWNNLYRGLVSDATFVPAGSKYRNNFEYLQALLRTTGLSKGKTQLGIIDPTGQDQSALQKALEGAIQANLTLPDYLSKLASTGFGTGSGKVAQYDTTTKYNKQVSTALQLIDESDAKSMFAEAYFKAYGMNPSADLITKFKTSWNAEAKKQLKSTTTEQVTKYEKI